MTVTEFHLEAIRSHAIRNGNGWTHATIARRVRLVRMTWPLPLRVVHA